MCRSTVSSMATPTLAPSTTLIGTDGSVSAPPLSVGSLGAGSITYGTATTGTLDTAKLRVGAPPRRPILVGFSGRLRSGKDTAAQVLIRGGFHHGSFARAIYDFMYALNPAVAITDDPADGWRRLAELVDEIGWEDAKDHYPEVRALLQRAGTEAGRNVLGEHVWVEAAMRNLPQGADVAFTDCRFPNEGDAIRVYGGIVIRVERPSLPEPGPDAHPSETAMDGYDFDATVVNDGTVTDLHTQVLSAVLSTARR